MSSFRNRRTQFPFLFLSLLLIFAGLISSAVAAPSPSPSSPQETLEERAFCRELKQIFGQYEYVAVTFLTETSYEEAVPVIVSVTNSRDLSAGKGPERTWFCVFRSQEHWQAATDYLSEMAAHLALTKSIKPDNKDLPASLVLLYHFPQPLRLEVADPPLLLSEKAQQYLTLDRVSDYSAARKVLIIEEPHYDQLGQYSLFKGLEIFFADNPQLLAQNQAAFLAEGLPAGEPLSVRPLVNAQPRPTDDLISSVLDSYLIPGYVAYEWKHQRGLPIIGLEDPRLYDLSARLWTEMQNGGSASSATLWAQTVAARNTSIVQTLLAQLSRRQLPILFVGGRHLEPLGENERISAQGWDRFEGSAGAAELDYLKRADKHSIEELLRAQGIGFYLLTARGEPVEDEERTQRQIAQYTRLFQAQLQGKVEDYIRALPRDSSGVTVAPSPAAAAQVVMQQASSGSKGKGDKKGGGDGNEDPGWGAKLRDLLGRLGDAITGRLSALAKRIASGHAFGKHVQGEGQFPQIQGRGQFADFIARILRNPSASKKLSAGREAFWDNASGTVVITDPSNPDGGTAFKPSGGRGFFDNLQ